jgi:hypothetical protein
VVSDVLLQSVDAEEDLLRFGNLWGDARGRPWPGQAAAKKGDPDLDGQFLGRRLVRMNHGRIYSAPRCYTIRALENEVWLWRAAPIYLPRMGCDLEALLRKTCGAEKVSMSDLTLV